MSPSCRALQGAEYQLRLSLFDATYHHFFGRTWRSSRRAARAAPPRPARAAFNEVGCWGGGRAGWVWENAGTPPGRGGDPAGRRLELQESSRRREVFKYVKGKAAFARAQPGAALLWCWFGSVSLWKRSSESSGSLRSARRSREPFKAASPKRARALARGRSVLLLSLVCGASFSCTQADSSSKPFSLPDPLPRVHPRHCPLLKVLCTVYWNGEIGLLGYLRGWATAWEQRRATACRLLCSEPAAESSVSSRVGRKGTRQHFSHLLAFFPYLGA